MTHVCPFQEEDSPQSPEEEPTEESESDDQAEPIRQNHATQHHPAPCSKCEYKWKLVIQSWSITIPFVFANDPFPFFVAKTQAGEESQGQGHS